jgi:hypothetical protein
MAIGASSGSLAVLAVPTASTMPSIGETTQTWRSTRAICGRHVVLATSLNGTPGLLPVPVPSETPGGGRSTASGEIAASAPTACPPPAPAIFRPSEPCPAKGPTVTASAEAQAKFEEIKNAADEAAVWRVHGFDEVDRGGLEPAIAVYNLWAQDAPLNGDLPGGDARPRRLGTTSGAPSRSVTLCSLCAQACPSGDALRHRSGVPDQRLGGSSDGCGNSGEDSVA